MLNGFVLSPFFLGERLPGLEELGPGEWRFNDAGPEERVLLTDARALDPGERELLEASKVTHLPRVEALLEHPLPEAPLWVHFDADVVDRGESPGHRYPEGAGPSSSTVRKVFRRIADSNRLAAVSVSSWDPDLDREETSQRVTMSLLETLVGARHVMCL